MQTYHIITIGCQMNKSDSERVAGYLEKNGYAPAADRKRADLVMVNTCGVRQSAEDRVYGLVPKIRAENPRATIIITGCLSEREDVRQRLGNKVDVWLPIAKISNYTPPLTPPLIRGGELKGRGIDYLKIKPKYSSRVSAFVPIGNGCDNFCAYCVVPYARGREVYRPAAEILAEVRGLVSKGYKEIILIAQNVNSYVDGRRQTADGRKMVDFADLLRMVNDIPGKFWLRFATSHPKDMSAKLISTMAGCDKVCEHVHLPAQAGDDEVLKRMRRGYTHKDYIQLIDKVKGVFKLRITNYELRINSKFKILKSKLWVPPVAITTDIIVGFPGETKKQFQNTVKLFREVKFDQAYIARYSPRPGTAAAKLEDDVPAAEKKRREEELMQILRQTARANNEKYVGKTVEVLVEGQGRDGSWRGKTMTGKTVKVRSKKLELRSKNNLAGEFVRVKITGAGDFGLEGILNNQFKIFKF